MSKNGERLWQVASCLFGAWDEAARRHAIACPGDNPEAFADFLAGEVAAGRSHVVHCSIDGERKGTAIFSAYMDRGRKVAYVQAGACDPNTPDGTFWNSVLPQIEDAARALGCVLIITGTARRQVAINYRDHGYDVTSLELTKSLRHGHV